MTQNQKTPINRISRVANHLASKVPSADLSNPNPIETLSLQDIDYLQAYLEQIKVNKMAKELSDTRLSQTGNRATDIYNPMDRAVPIDWRTFSKSSQLPINEEIIPGPRGSACTRSSKKSQQNWNTGSSFNMDFGGRVNDYHNPYEYGARQNGFGQLSKQPYTGEYDNDPIILNEMGISDSAYREKFPDHIRNINLESSLLQREMTHIPGQRRLAENEIDRFERLPFDPQDHRHLVWQDNMPRTGYPTRIDRLEL
jgi:hypothetical protein